jgi:hypothetical protein
MYGMNRRLKKVEEKLSINERHTTVNIAHFGGELPPDHTDGNITVHYVMYDERVKR